MGNSWIEHVKKYAQEHNIKYKEAMSKAKATYKGSKKGGSLTAAETGALIKSSYDRKNKDIGDFKIDKSLSGKRTKVYFNEAENKPVIVHRGTDSIQDVGTDLGLMFGYRGKRFKHAEKMQKKVEKKYGTDNLHTLGHSLGGIVAEEVGGKSKNVITLNKAVSPWEINRVNGKNQTDIKTSNDPVSMLNKFNNNNNKTSVIKSEGWNPLAEHSSDVLSRVSPDKVYGDGMRRVKKHKKKITLN